MRICGLGRGVEARGVLAPRDSIEEEIFVRQESRLARRYNYSGKEVPKSRMYCFPHDTHIEVLDCKSCHPSIFKKEAGLTGISNERNLGGRVLREMPWEGLLPSLQLFQMPYGFQESFYKQIDFLFLCLIL